MHRSVPRCWRRWKATSAGDRRLPRGACGRCKTKVVSGEYIVSSTMTLTDAEIAEGYVLACSCHPQGIWFSPDRRVVRPTRAVVVLSVGSTPRHPTQMPGGANAYRAYESRCRPDKRSAIRQFFIARPNFPPPRNARPKTGNRQRANKEIDQTLNCPAPVLSSDPVSPIPTISHATIIVNASTSAAGRVRIPRISRQGATTSPPVRHRR